MKKSIAIGAWALTASVGFLGGIVTERYQARHHAAEEALKAGGPRYRVMVGAAPTRGPATAKVTIIEYSDFQCPFCSRVEDTLHRIEKEYGGKVRLVWKDRPLPFHGQAMLAAEAARAAGEQGKFWEMHDKLFANQQALDRASLEKYAGELGLDVGRFKAALDDHRHQKTIEADVAEAENFGARGTPSFFINGRPLRGAQPFEQFKKVIEDELVLARSSYEDTVKDGLAKAEAPAAPQRPSGPPAEDKTVYQVEIGTAPIRGAKSAPITIVEFSDFQCPFCARVESTLAEILKAYGNKVRIAWKNYPLPFHDKADLAAQAALAAGEQGKFWEMHDKLFANPQALDRASLEKYAGELRLDLRRFREALDSGKLKGSIQKDVAQANTVAKGGMGTPTFFVNGRKIEGAQPIEAFKKVIDEELARKHLALR